MHETITQFLMVITISNILPQYYCRFSNRQPSSYPIFSRQLTNPLAQQNDYHSPFGHDLISSRQTEAEAETEAENHHERMYREPQRREEERSPYKPFPSFVPLHFNQRRYHYMYAEGQDGYGNIYRKHWQETTDDPEDEEELD